MVGGMVVELRKRVIYSSPDDERVSDSSELVLPLSGETFLRNVFGHRHHKLTSIQDVENIKKFPNITYTIYGSKFSMEYRSK
mmetsp:Transcript_22002/g.32063  ORF Transcript_22002/g.32063 Transcript_22002/m.32063 type:complete len:82 (+) Transcript_22002:2142-2387(+)